MKPSIALSAIAFALCASTGFAAENLVELDASGGKAKDHHVIFVSKAMAQDAPAGTAAVAAYAGDKFEGAFGMSVQAGKPVASAVSEDVIKSERASEKEPATSTMVIAVSDEQYSEVKALIEKWSAIEEHIDAPNNVTANFVVAVVDALGMKRAYRSGLQPVNPIQYFEDLAVINRKLGKENT
jgi:hypothetical protein